VQELLEINANYIKDKTFQVLVPC